MAVACVGFVALAFALSGGGATPPRSVRTASLDRETSIAVAPDQSGDPAQIVIDSVDLPQRGYVVAHRSVGGAPAEVLGTSKALESGSHRNVHVALAKRPRRSVDLVMVLHREDGADTGLSYPAGDPPFSDRTGVIAVPVTVDPD